MKTLFGQKTEKPSLTENLMQTKRWQRYQKYLNAHPSVGITLDVTHMNFSENFLERMEAPMQAAFQAMKDLEKGALANPDENRRVGHYWLRCPSLAPTEAIRQAIETTVAKVQRFASEVHRGVVLSPTGKLFKNLLLIGIGGSALGPQFLSQALGAYSSQISFHCIDNTDPDGIDQILKSLQDRLDETLVVVVSKSGGTAETRNGMLEAQGAYGKAGLEFAKHAVAVTGVGSSLEQTAQAEQWLEIFPMWDWVGGRTSELSAVGLLPAALEGVEIEALLSGAAEMDRITRQKDVRQNPAALLALMWHYAGAGHGQKDMVILPYKDRLSFLSRYLQQLIMESLGKEKDVSNRVVHQGIVVYGNKGSTDQHAYVQQLREGLSDFFVTFVEVLKERDGASLEVESGVTAGDFLQGFLLGTQEALHENGRESLVITLEQVEAKTLGALIALYERAVGLYAELVGINAYHQPGVEAGKKAAGSILALQKKICQHLQEHPGQFFTVEELVFALGGSQDPRLVHKILEFLAFNRRGIVKKSATLPQQSAYGAS